MKIIATLTGAFCAMAVTTLGAAPISSTFDTSTDGWTAFGDTAAPVSFVATGGNPGGFIQVLDSVSGGVMYFTAPAKFLGNESQAYGTNLTFDLMQFYTDPPNQFADSVGDVLLTGSGTTLAFDTPSNPANGSWSSYSVPLLANAGWHLNDLNGAAPSAAQMELVMADLTALSIRAEYQTGPDTDSLDNVQMAPEPSTLTLMIAAGYIMTFVIRRRQSA